MRALVFQHIDVEHPGFLRDLLAADGSTWDVVALDAGEPIPVATDEYDALLVMGGPMDVWDEVKLPWLVAEKQAISRWVLGKRAPFLGVCLGHQLLAEVIGGSVGLMARAEVGVCDVSITDAGRREPMFEGIPSPFSCLQWHSAEVTRLPPGAVVAATNGSCAIQAFGFGGYAFGLQFHVEATGDTVGEWGAVPAYRESLASVAGPDGLQQLATAVHGRLASFNDLARQMYKNFSAVVEHHSVRSDRTLRRTAAKL